MSRQEESVGQRINYVRKERRLTLEGLAQRAGLSKSFLWEVENGRSGISGSRLLQVAEALGASVDYLLKGGPARRDEAPQSVDIPAELSEVAEELGLSFRQTRILLDVDRSIVARRGNRAGPRKNKEAWRSLYEAVSPFMEEDR